jgi:succinate dehydrogenase flavin-adding protein (antitoxin of CptAB toxin-antitoxin module)
MEEEITTEQHKNSKVPPQLLPHVFKKGQSGNPSGKPKGTISLKKFAQKYIQELSEEEKLEFLEGIPKKDIWEMAEGKAKQDTELSIPQGLNIVFDPTFNKNANTARETETSNTE